MRNLGRGVGVYACDTAPTVVNVVNPLDNTIQVEFQVHVVGSIATSEHASNKYIYLKEWSLARDNSVRIDRSRNSTFFCTTVLLSVLPQSSKTVLHIEWAEIRAVHHCL